MSPIRNTGKPYTLLTKVFSPRNANREIPQPAAIEIKENANTIQLAVFLWKGMMRNANKQTKNTMPYTKINDLVFLFIVITTSFPFIPYLGTRIPGRILWCCLSLHIWGSPRIGVLPAGGFRIPGRTWWCSLWRRIWGNPRVPAP